MNIISKEFHFSASHILEGLYEGHPCGRLHGHNYIIKVFLKGEPNDIGFVQDYGELKPIKEYVDNILDHRHLNDVFPLHNPSVENMSKIIFDYFKPQFPLLYAIEMSETPKTNCRYEG
jgi:6-pyruvoyltetrahydropterin/6-carboxytetrahydropterin synthase